MRKNQSSHLHKEEVLLFRKFNYLCNSKEAANAEMVHDHPSP